MLTTLWRYADRGSITPQQLYGVAATAEISDIYLTFAEKFRREALPYHTKVLDEKTHEINYELPPEAEVRSHLLYEVLLKNRATFLRFMLNTYCEQDADAVLDCHEFWVFLVQWANQYEIPVEYLPVSNRSLAGELEDMGYLKSKSGTGWGFWGVRLP